LTPQLSETILPSARKTIAPGGLALDDDFELLREYGATAA
jgi:hypothetical protein